MGSEFSHLKSAELSSWNGKAYIGGRKHSNLIKSLAELDVPGIYLLISKDDRSSVAQLYVGEADSISGRIYNHYVQKDWWDTFVAFVSKDSNLTKAHVRYLEKEFHHIVKQNTAGLMIMNESDPTGSKLPPSDIDEMHEFLSNMLFILENLGVVDFAAHGSNVAVEDNYVFYLNLGKGRVDAQGKPVQAHMVITEDGYRLLKGSYIDTEEKASFADHAYHALRANLEQQKFFGPTDVSGCLLLSKDADFTSASAAAAVVKNRSVNGRKEWRLFDGTTLDDHEAMVKKAAP
jgi:Domain of unknown function (DUF4357)